MTIQLKAIVQYVHVAVFKYVVQGWFHLLSLWVKPQSATIQMKATEQLFQVVLFTWHSLNGS